MMTMRLDSAFAKTVQVKELLISIKFSNQFKFVQQTNVKTVRNIFY